MRCTCGVDVQAATIRWQRRQVEVGEVANWIVSIVRTSQSLKTRDSTSCLRRIRRAAELGGSDSLCLNDLVSSFHHTLASKPADGTWMWAGARPAPAAGAGCLCWLVRTTPTSASSQAPSSGAGASAGR